MQDKGFVHAHVMCVHIVPTVSVVFLLEYTVMLLLITSVKVRSTRTYMCEISSVSSNFVQGFDKSLQKLFVIPPQISSFSANEKSGNPEVLLW